MSGSYLIGFQCGCGRRAVYVREVVMKKWGRPGETIHDVRLRMRCRCGRKPPNGPYPFDAIEDSNRWVCGDRGGVGFPKAEER